MSKHRLKARSRVGVLAAAGLLAWSLAPVGSVFAATTPQQVTLAGADRMATAIAIANAQYPNGPSSGIVILASGANANLIDSVTAAPLAKALGAPILLSQDQSTLGSETMNYLTSHNITKVYLIGAAANPTLASQLPAGVTTVNVTGADRYATAAQIAQQLAQAEGKSSFSTVYVASGDDPDLSDALAIAPWAAAAGDPVLLAAPGQTSLPSSEASFVTGSSSQTEVVVGTAVGYNLSAGGDTQKTIGSGSNDNYANAVAIAQAMAPSSGYTAVDIANDSSTDVVNANGMISYHLVDAITGGPYAASQGAPILFTNGANIPSSVQSFLTSSLVKGVGTVQVFGGTASIPSSTVSQIVNTISGSAPPTSTAQGSVSKITVTGQNFGTGSVTDPAVALNGAPITVSATLLDANGNPVPNVNLQLYFTNGTFPVTSVTSNGQSLSEVVVGPTGNTAYFNVPTNAQGVASAQLSEASGTSTTVVVQYWGPYIQNGVQVTSNKAYLEFVGQNGLAISPPQVANQGFAVGSAVPVVVTLPPLNGQEPVNVGVQFTLSSQQPNQGPSGCAYFSTNSGASVGSTNGQSLTVYTNSNGQATVYVSSQSDCSATVQVQAQDAGGTFTGTTNFTFGQAGIPSAVHNFGVSGVTGGTLASGFTAQVGSDVTFYAQAVDANGNPVPNAQLIVVAGGNGNNTDSYVQNGTTTPFPYVVSAGSTLSGSPAATTSVGELVTANGAGYFNFTVTNSTATGSKNPSTGVVAQPNNYMVYPVENGTVDTTAAPNPDGIIDGGTGSQYGKHVGIVVTWQVSGTLTSIGVQGVPSIQSTDTSVSGIQAQSMPQQNTTQQSAFSLSTAESKGEIATLYAEGFSGGVPFPSPNVASNNGGVTFNIASTGNASLVGVDGVQLPPGGTAYQVQKSAQVSVSDTNGLYTISTGGTALGYVGMVTVPANVATLNTVSLPTAPNLNAAPTVIEYDQNGNVVIPSVSVSQFSSNSSTFTVSANGLTAGDVLEYVDPVGAYTFQIPSPLYPEMVRLDFADTSAENATVTISQNTVSATASLTFTAGFSAGNGQLGAASPVSTNLAAGQFATVTLTVEDANGNPIPNSTVDFAYDNMPDLWITAINGVTLQLNEPNGNNATQPEPTPLPLFNVSSLTGNNTLGYGSVVIPGVVNATVTQSGTPIISVQTNSQGQVSLTIADGAQAYYHGAGNANVAEFGSDIGAVTWGNGKAYFWFYPPNSSGPSLPNNDTLLSQWATSGGGTIVLSQNVPSGTSSVGTVTWQGD